MNKVTESIVEQDRLNQLRAMMPVLDTRVTTLRQLLVEAADTDIEFWRIDLARADVAAVLEVMAPTPTEDEDFLPPLPMDDK